MITNPLSTVAFWFALQDSTLENGCLWAIPESHKKNTTYFMKRDPNDYENETVFEGKKEEYDLKEAVPLEVKKGSLIFFDGNLVHYSKENKSEKPRHALTIHFVEMNEQYKWD